MTMDGESSYESDISESWSLIDINLNEESLTATEAFSELEKSCQSDLNVDKLSGTNETDLEDFVRKCKEINQTDFTRLSDSDSDASLNNQGLPNCNGTEAQRIDSPSKRSSDNDGLQDSGDSESIEILDIESEYLDSEIRRLDVTGIDHLDFPTYQSDDEESLEERIDNENRNNNSTVIKRRRKRVNRSPEDTVNTVNSENRSSTENNATPGPSDASKEGHKLIEAISSIDAHPVYKHYRNNVANTILSLSVAVIFAGVACIAVGHFLGVQDAAETAVELVETLKKLQLENAALQSRLSHLNRALLTQDTNSKSEMPLNQPTNEAPVEQPPQVDPRNCKQSDLNNAALSEIRSSLNSIEWLSRLQNFVHKNNKVTDTEYGIDFNGFGKYIHDQLYTLNLEQEEGAKFLEDTDRKISKVLHKIISRLSSSQDHIEKLYERLIKLKNKLNHKIKRIFPESSKENEMEKAKPKSRVPVTELDLQTMTWNPDIEVDKSSDGGIPKAVILYKFPQPESYYENFEDTGKKQTNVTSTTGVSKKKDSERKEKTHKSKKKHKREDEKSEKKKYRSDSEESDEKKHSKDSWKKKRCKDKETKEKKRRKRDTEKMHKSAKNSESGRKNKDRIVGSKHKRFTENQNVFNQTIFQTKMSSKMEEKKSAPKLRFKKVKNSKLRRVLLPKQKKRSYLKRRQYNPICPGPECFNLTGDWVFKWAGGREEIRRHQTLGDWQFDRAKARKEQRDDNYEENWQFKRAIARENNRNDIRWRRGKYVGKDFFHEGFSWI